MLCLQEIKIASSDIQGQNALRRAVNHRKDSTEMDADDGPEYNVYMTLPSDKFNARGLGGKGRVYGVASIIREDFGGRYVKQVRTVEWDKEGRFSVVEISDPETDARLSIWNVYAVNGTSNKYRDQRTGEVTGTRHDRKRAVHRMLMKECKRLEDEGSDVLVVGDLNVAPQRVDGHPNLRTYPEQHVINRADFNNRFLDPTKEDGFRGIDVWRKLRDEERKYTYHSPNRIWGSSCDRVDLAIASRRLVDEGRIMGCEIWDSKVERGPSDHVPLSVDIKLSSNAV